MKTQPRQTNAPPAPLTDLTNWISLAECAARLPSVQPNKRMRSYSVLRLARRHGLKILKRGPYRFVYWPDVLATFQPEHVKPTSPPRFQNTARRTLAQSTEEILRKHKAI
jgi:hypothetical protein